jgi:hypothetical protein
MKNKALKLGGAAAVILVLAYFGVELALGSIVTAGVNRYAPKIIHTKVTLLGARISPFTGSGTLTGLIVGNPDGWSSDQAFAMETIHVKAVPSSLFGDHIVVQELLIEKPEFVYETRFLSSNIGDLLKGMSDSTAAGADGQATTRSGKPIRFEVRHFRLVDGHVTLGIGAAAIRLPMTTIDLSDLGTPQGGITSDQLALAIMRSVTASIVRTTTQAVGKVGSTLGAGAVSGIRSLFGGSH